MILKDGMNIVDGIKPRIYLNCYIKMPVMGGVDAIKEIRSEPSLKTLPCIAISAYSLMHEVQFYLNIGFDCYIPKPFKLSEIHDTLDKYQVSLQPPAIYASPSRFDGGSFD